MKTTNDKGNNRRTQLYDAPSSYMSQYFYPFLQPSFTTIKREKIKQLKEKHGENVHKQAQLEIQMQLH